MPGDPGPTGQIAGATWRPVADPLRGRWPTQGALLHEAEQDVLACMPFPPLHRTKWHKTHPSERPNKAVKRRAHVLGIVPNEDSILRLIGAVRLGANDDGQLQNPDMPIEGTADRDAPAAETRSLIPSPRTA